MTMELHSRGLSEFRLLAFSGIGAALSLVLAVVLRLGTDSLPGYVAKFQSQMFVISLIYAITLYAFTARSPGWRHDPAVLVVTHVSANAAAWLVSLALVYFQGVDRIGRGVFVLFGLLHLVVSGIWRSLSERLTERFATTRRALIVGAGEPVKTMLGLLRENQRTRLTPLALVQIGNGKAESTVDLPVYTGSAVLNQVATSVGATCVILTPPYLRDEELVMQLFQCRLRGIEILDAVQLSESILGRVPLGYIDDHWGLFLSLSRIRPINSSLKRIVDLVLSAGLLVAVAPLMLTVAALIKVFMPGPVLYRQERLGQHGVPFELIKFRTMVPDAEAKTGAVWAQEDDPRITRFGWILRRTRLDELPQLVNVLRGDMSFVGPRPERELFVADFLQKVPVFRSGRRKADPEGAYFIHGFRESINLYSTRLLLKPGITGWAQVRYPYAASLEESREKFEYDLYYIKNQSMLFDLAILLRTVWMVVNPKGR